MEIFKSILSTNYRNFIKSRNYFLHYLLIFCFSFFYILKQTIISEKIITNITFVLYLLILIASAPTLLEYFRTNFEKVILLIWSISIAWLLFLNNNEFIIIISKLILFLYIYLLDKKNKSYGSFYMALGFFLGIILIWILIMGGYIQETYTENPNWKKNNFGFHNPNIGPFFVMAIIYGLWVSKKKFIPYVIALIILFYAYYDFFSRTQILFTCFITIAFIFLSLGLFRKLLFLSKFAIIVFAVFLICYIFLSTGILNQFINKLEYLNNLSSNRILSLSNLSILVNLSGPIINIKKIDSLIYDLIIFGGPLIIILFIYNIYLIYKHNQNVNYAIMISGILLIGIFEGVLNKISLFGAGFISIIDYKLKKFRLKENGICSKKIDLQKICKIIAVPLTVLILFLYFTPVYQIKINGNNINPNIFQDAIVQSKSDFVCKNFNFRLLENDDNVEVILTNNTLSVNPMTCAQSYINLVIKDMSDKNLDFLNFTIFVDEFHEMEKKNLWRYFAALIILNLVFFSRILKSFVNSIRASF